MRNAEQCQILRFVKEGERKREREKKENRGVREDMQTVENNQKMFITCSSEYIYIAFTLCVQNWNSCRMA